MVKKRGWIILLVGVTLCAGVLLLWRLVLRMPIKGESVSPDGTYAIRVGWNETEVWPHHAPPLDVKLQGYRMDPKEVLFTLPLTLDNDKGDARMGEDIHIFWESDSLATVLLLGCYQIPEVITVDFRETSAQTPAITRERSYSAARDCLLAHAIPLSGFVGVNAEE